MSYMYRLKQIRIQEYGENKEKRLESLFFFKKLKGIDITIAFQCVREGC